LDHRDENEKWLQVSQTLQDSDRLYNTLLKSYPKMAAMIAATNAMGLELEEQFLKAVELGDVAEVQRLLEAGVNVCYVDKVTTRCVRITPYSRLKSSMGVDFRMAILPSTRPVEMEMQGL
jgi:hypothetical protein